MIIAMPRAAGARAIAVAAALSLTTNTTPAAANEQPAEATPESSAAFEFGPQIVRSAGKLLVVWKNTAANGDTDIHGQRLSVKTAARAGFEFPINISAKLQREPAVAVLKDGTAVVVWTSAHDGIGIYGRRVDPRTGIVSGPEFRIDAGDRAWSRSAPAIAPLNDGGFVVVWVDYTQNKTFADIHGQVFNAGGKRRGRIFVVANSHISEHSPDVAALANGGFAVIWNTSGSLQVQRYAANGVKTGRAITPFAWSSGRIAGLADGGFAVVGTVATSVLVRNAYAQRFAADGTADEAHQAFPSRQIQWTPAVSPLPNGGYVMVWSEGFKDICGMRYSSDGEPDGSSFCTEAVPAGARAEYPSVAAITNDRFAITFELKTKTAYGVTAGILDLSEEAHGSPRFAPLATTQKR